MNTYHLRHFSVCFFALAISGTTHSSENNTTKIWGSINYLDWTSKAEENSKNSGGLKEDFGYLELSTFLERGKLSAFGFIDFENPNDGLRTGFRKDVDLSSDFRIASKLAVSYLFNENNNLSLYGQIYSFDIPAINFYDRNYVLGLKKSYKDFSKGVKIFEPFIGLHYESTSDLEPGFNGFMVGWSGQVPFEMFNTQFRMESWHETEFARQEKFTQNAAFIPPGSFKSYDETGHNGAIGIWKSLGGDNRYLQPDIGVQYRYSDQKLGTAAQQDGFIFTLKFQLNKE